MIYYGALLLRKSLLPQYPQKEIRLAFYIAVDIVRELVGKLFFEVAICLGDVRMRTQIVAQGQRVFQPEAALRT